MYLFLQRSGQCFMLLMYKPIEVIGRPRKDNSMHNSPALSFPLPKFPTCLHPCKGAMSISGFSRKPCTLPEQC